VQRETLRRAARRLATSRLVLVAAGLLGGYALAGFLLAPGLIERYAPRYLEDRLPGELAFAGVRVNPFLLTLEVRDVTLRTEGAPPLLAVERLFVDFAFASVFRRAWTFSEIRIDGFALDVVLEPDGRPNLAALLDRLRGDDGAAPAEGPRLHIERAAATGRVTVTDRGAEAPSSVVIAPIDIRIDDLSTASARGPDQRGRYAVAASLPHGGRIAWQGDLSVRPLASSGEVAVSELALATAWPLAGDRFALAPPEGKLGLAVRYRFAYAERKATFALDDIRLQIDGLAVTAPDSPAPLLALSTVRIAGGRFDLARRELHLETVELRDGTAQANVDAAGVLDWQRLARAPSPANWPDGKPDGPPWQVTANSIEIRRVGLHYTDRSRAPAIAIDTHGLDASLRLEARASGASSPDAGAGIVASDIRIALRQVAFSELGADAPLVRLDALTTTGGRLDTAARQIAAGALDASGGSVRLMFQEDGRLELAGMLTPARAGAIRREAGALARSARDAGRPWRYSVARASVEALQLDVAARGSGDPIRYPVAVTSAELTQVTGGGAEPMRFDATLSTSEGGTLRAAGTIAQDLGSAEATLTADEVNLAPLRPLVARYARLDLASGRASASSNVRYGAARSPRLAASGTFTIADLRLNEAGTTDRFLSWQNLAASGVNLAVEPGRLSIGEIRVQAPGGKIVIDAERRLNLAQVLRRDAAAQRGAADGAQRGAAATVRPRRDRGQAFPVRIARVILRDGTVDFSDLSLALPFATRVRRLNGTVLGISSDPKSRAELKLAGLVQDSGSARAEGALSPFEPTAFTDIRADFNNVAMPALSPYAVTFAGRRIDSGRLWLDLHYRIVDRRLTAANKIVLDEFTLGERVASAKALDLPLDLAIALLSDENGRISVAIPLEGDLGSPRFDYGRLVREALGNLLTRIVSAPFRFLGRLAGGGAELEAVHFEPGRARLEPPERETLAQVAKVLAERPQLKLVVRGPYDPRRDGEALRADRVRRDLAGALGVALEPRQDPGPVAYGDADAQRALERLLLARGGADALDRLATAYGKRSGKAPDRVNPIFAAFGRASPDREFYEAVFRRLVELEPLDDGALQALAARRSQAIVGHLLKSSSLDPGRIEAGEVRQVESTGAPSVDAELGLAAISRSS